MPARPFTPTVPEVRGAIHRRVRRVRAEFWGILQTTVAAGSAWALASLLHPHPYFAPASAVIALGVSRGGRTIRAIELTAGVAVGILVADVIVRALGANTLVLMLVVGLSMAAALLLGAGAILVNQAAMSGILIVATLQPGASPSPSRFLDALIGGAVALLVGQVLFPRDPVRAMAQAARPVVERPVGRAEGAWPRRCATATSARRRRALEIARPPTTTSPSFFDAVALARETLHLSPPAPAHARARAALRRGGAADGLRGAQHPRARPPGAGRGPSLTGPRRPSWPTRSRCSARPCSSSATSSSTPSATRRPRRLALRPP